MKTVFILSITSDIGRRLTEKYLQQGCRVVGTYRSAKHLKELQAHPRLTALRCDAAVPSEIEGLAREFKKRRIIWDTFISCVGQPLPVLPFFECKFKEWGESVHVNCLAQLQALHVLYPFRNKRSADVVYFAGGGMNGTVVNFSAYTVSKILLTKMCEFLDAENKDLNIFIVGPGWTKTKIHDTILADRRTASAKVKETKSFLRSKPGTDLDEIFECIDWLCHQGKAVASGRNFSVVYDPWRKGKRNQLVKALQADADMYKMRRQGNGFLQ